MGLWYPKDYGFELIAFSDADHAECIDTCKSTYGGIQFLGDKLVSWMSKKQDCTAMSSAEVEYVALSTSCAQVMWMRIQLNDYGFNYNKISLYCDSQSAIAISCNPVQHSRFSILSDELLSALTQQNWRGNQKHRSDTLSIHGDEGNPLEPTFKQACGRYLLRNSLQGRLLDSFQEDAKYEHVGQDTRSQDSKDDQDKQGKDLKISEQKTNSKKSLKG
ncbi:hypothetical protein Tco_0179013 [Tanacetum coccineum]